jgi:hypothetical protein
MIGSLYVSSALGELLVDTCNVEKYISSLVFLSRINYLKVFSLQTFHPSVHVLTKNASTLSIIFKLLFKCSMLSGIN